LKAERIGGRGIVDYLHALRTGLSRHHQNRSNTMQTKNIRKPGSVRSRDPVRTQAEILSVAVAEFAEHGFHGARIERITKGAKCNSRMIYHYFGSKEKLYIAALDSVFAAIRNQEARLDFSAGDPAQTAVQLVEFTFDYFTNNASFLKMTRNENLLDGKYIQRSQMIRDMSQPLIAAIGKLIERGVASGAFAHRADPVQLYLSIVALSAHHLNNGATLGIVVGKDLTDGGWQADRRAHAVEMVRRYLGIAEPD
jgi:AcrR family transcriptional regulator